MKTPKNPVVAVRKRPRQARSTRMVEDILEAAVRVLEREGAPRFTTARVAERAGISVGSLYQYFPNKEAILFRLQSDEWTRTGNLLADILADTRRLPMQRLRRMVEAFFRSECEEAALRVALADAAPLYRQAPEAREARRAGQRHLLAFVAEVLPDAKPARHRFVAELLATVMSATGKQISERGRPQAEVSAMARAVGDMFCAWLEHAPLPRRG